MLPKKFTFQLDTQNQIVAWILNENLTYEEAVQAKNGIIEIVSKLPQGKVKVIADLRPLEEEEKMARFSNAASQESAELMGWLANYCSHVAVLCGSILMRAQMTRLASESGLGHKLQAFWSPSPGKAANDAFQFLGISSHPLIK